MSNPESEPTENVRNFLTSNRTGAALVKEHEEWLVRVKRPLVDLRSIPSEEWPEYYGRDVALPPEIQRYLDGREMGPMAQEEADGLEDVVMRYHGVSAPFYIQLSRHDWEQHGHAWHFIPEAAPYVSGFEFNNSEA